MRVVIQRVLSASVQVGQDTISAISRGSLLLVCVEKGDSLKVVSQAAEKIFKLRYFSDEQGKMNLSINQVSGEFLVVSQFTLSSDFERGLRPSFEKSESPDSAKELFDAFVSTLNKHVPCKTGVFGADMKIDLTNDGPVTFSLTFGSER